MPTAPRAAVITTAPVTSDLPPPPDPTPIESLTGGDPFTFCPTVPPALRAAATWGEAILGASPAEAGMIDLVYGPLLRRDLSPYVDTAPNELADASRGRCSAGPRPRSAPSGTWASREQDIKELAKSATRALDSPTQPDGLSVSLFLANVLRQKIDENRLNEIAVVFASGQPDPATMLDFGYVPPEVSAASGFSSAPVLASI